MIEDDKTYLVKEAGGAMYVIDVPRKGTHRREQFEARIDAGQAVVVSECEPDSVITEDGEPKPPPPRPEGSRTPGRRRQSPKSES